MSTRCCITYCRNNLYISRNSGISFHRFPKNSEIRDQWVIFCGDSKVSESSRICSVHFKKTDFVRDLRNELTGNPPRNLLKEGAVPSILFGKNHESDEKENEHKYVVEEISNKTGNNEDRQHSKGLMEHSAQNVQHNETPQSQPQTSDHPNYKEMYEKLSYQNVALQSENRSLKEDNTSQKKKLRSFENQIRYYRSKGHKAQIKENKMNKMLLQKKKRVNWSPEEMATAFTLRFYSKKSYIFMKEKLNYPLPSLSSLRRWAMKLQMRQGILEDILYFMKLTGEELSDMERCVVIQFDEVKIRNVVEYDPLNDEIVGPFSQMQVVMARGLFAKWKQPIFVDFDTKITKDLLLDIITKLHAINYNVVACVSDCGASNIGLWKQLNVDINKTFFKHSVINSNVYIFADTPHMLKLLCNWLLDTGFKLSNGITINKKPLEDLIRLTDSEINVCFKIGEKHVTCENTARQNVRLAAELMSHTTATALQHYKLQGDENEINALASFIELVNGWFDVFNSYTPINSLPTKCAYGVKLDEQNKIMDDMKNTISTMRPIGKNALQIFQKGILISINSLRMLFEDMKETFSASYILTHRINQDSLENFFFQLRSREGPYDHPSPINALNRIRMIILGKNPGVLQAKTNTEDRADDEYMVARMFKKANINFRQEVLQEDPGTTSTSSSTSDQQSAHDANINIIDSSEQETTNDALEYIAGYLAKKYKQKYPALGSYTYKTDTEHNYTLPSWVQHLSYGGLIKPSEKWFEEVKACNKMFHSYHLGRDDSYRTGKNVSKKLVKKIAKKHHDLPVEIIKTFVKLRTTIRLNYINYKQSTLKKRKASDCSGGSCRRSKKMKKLMN